MISLLGCFCCKTFVTGFAKKGPYPANIDFSYCRFYGDGRVLLKLKLLFPWTYQLLYFQFLDSCGCTHFNKANKREEKAACRIPSVRIRKGLLGTLQTSEWHARISEQLCSPDQVAKAIRYIGQEDFDLFGDSDRHALMALVEDYFCEDEPTEMSSGKPVVSL